MYIYIPNIYVDVASAATRKCPASAVSGLESENNEPSQVKRSFPAGLRNEAVGNSFVMYSSDLTVMAMLCYLGSY
jgi:hypothetical protein